MCRMSLPNVEDCSLFFATSFSSLRCCFSVPLVSNASDPPLFSLCVLVFFCVCASKSMNNTFTNLYINPYTSRRDEIQINSEFHSYR